ncbi:MAG: hypothetical protein GX902_12745 [Lentisphaerae bacterium]|nr:hypothetical protein [Lentisphaerota bacterium]
MQAGFFTTDITPPLGTMRAGNYRRMYISGIAGPLKVRAAVFEQDGCKVGFAGVDCCTLSQEVIAQALDFAAVQGGLKLDYHIISASHTHSGGAVSSFFDLALLRQADPKVAALLKDSPVPDQWFTDWVARQLGTALVMADKKREEAWLNIGTGQEDSMIFNRRFRLRDGRAYTHPGILNPDIVEAAGPVDPQVGVIGAWREDGSLIGWLLNYSCHGTTYSGSSAHGDWYHFAEETLQKLFGTASAGVILNGPCGDVTQVNNQAAGNYFGLEISRRLGFLVGAEAAKVLVRTPIRKWEKIAGCRETLMLPRRVPTPESLQKAWQDIAQSPDNPNAPDAMFARERLLAGELARLQPEREVSLTAIQLGSAVLLANPAELFTSLALKVRKNSHFPVTMLVELANDSIGYVPDAEAFDRQSGGGYETVLTAYSNLHPEAGEQIASTLSQMANRLTPEILDEPAPPEPGTPWDYGRRGPDWQ